MKPEELKQAIEEGIPGARVLIKDLTGTADHYQAIVGADAFAGKTLVQQHQMVYQAVGPKVGGEVHALSLKTCTPADFDRLTEGG
jgi:stress-induced morphogen